ncbi:MAG: hypothetical protein NTX03_11035 [Bacteroidetes bacterium]|nr:hypothetical protein [Bacteroidota bacterium]
MGFILIITSCNSSKGKSLVTSSKKSVVDSSVFTDEEIKTLQRLFVFKETDSIQIPFIGCTNDSLNAFWGREFPSSELGLFLKLFKYPFTRYQSFLPTLSYRLFLDKIRDGFLIRIGGWNCTSQTQIWVFDYSLKKFTDTLDVSFSEGDAGASLLYESWVYDFDNDGDLDVIKRSNQSLVNGIMSDENLDSNEFKKGWQKFSTEILKASMTGDLKKDCLVYNAEKIELFRFKNGKFIIDKNDTIP